MESVTAPNEAGEKTAKKPRQRSVAYPSFTIDFCVDLTTKVDKEFTSVVFTPANAISDSIGLSGGTFLMQISSCVQYGLLELKSGEGYKPTARFQKIKSPLPSENVNDSLIECFQSPPLYKKLIAEFGEKQLPSEKGLANILSRNYDVYDKAAIIAAKVFLTNVSNLGLKTESDVLKLETTYIPFEETNSEDEVQEKKVVNSPNNTQLILPNVPEQRQKEQKIDKLETKEIPIFLKGNNREAKIILPIDFTEEDLSRIVKVLSAYL